MNPLLRMGCAASGSREKAFTIVVGTALELLTDWRGGGVVGIIDPIPTGSLVPSSFSRGLK